MRKWIVTTFGADRQLREWNVEAEDQAAACMLAQGQAALNYGHSNQSQCVFAKEIT